MNKQLILYISISLSVLAISTGVSYMLFSSYTAPQTSKTVTKITPTPGVTTKKPKIDPSIPRTAPCPLNGQYFTEGERAIWETRRPLAVMIENHLNSRPTSGLQSADIVYEAIAEGGITRNMGIFYCGITDQTESTMFAPVRSARIYFVRLVPEYDALYNHVGGAGICSDPTVNDKARALCYIQRNNIKDLDQFGRAGDFKTCHRVTNRLDREVEYEHTMACFSNELYSVAEKYKWTNVDAKGVSWDKNFVQWKFKSDSPTTPTASTIDIEFSSNKPEYNTTWKYDPTTNTYKKFHNSTEPALDLNTGESLTTKNVVVQLVKEQGPLDEHFHMYYETTGTGTAYIFQDGQVVEGAWSKKSDASRTKFTTKDGKEVEFNRGPIWIELVSTSRPPKYN